MLDAQDLQAIQQLIETSISASEARMSGKFDASISASEARMSEKIDASISASETRMFGKIDASISASEARMSGKIDASISASEARMRQEIKTAVSGAESRIMQNTAVLMESRFQPQFNLLAEGQADILSKLVPRSRVDDLEDEVRFLKSIVMRINDDLQNLKKAQ